MKYMCTVTIVDTSALGMFEPRPSKERNRDLHLCSWIRQRHGMLAYCNSGRYYEELRHSERIWRMFGEYRRGQQALLIDDSKLARAAETLQNAPIRCNDRHVLELALASDTLVLCANDNGLKRDFTRADVLPWVGGRCRDLYPVDAPADERRAFLEARECPSRATVNGN